MSEIDRAIEIFRAEIRQGFAQVDARFEQVDARFDRIEGRFGQRFTDIELKIDAIALNLKALERDHGRRLRNLEGHVKKLEGQG